MASLLFVSETSFRACLSSPYLKERSLRLLFEERRIEVRAVNLRVAQDARLEKACLVMERRSPRRPAEAGRRVALQAEQFDFAKIQHVRIWSAVRHMARLASIDLYGLLLKTNGPCLSVWHLKQIAS